MTNFEKYKDSLMKIKRCFAIDKNTGKIVRCDSHIDCGNCIFDPKECLESDKIEWLYEEYKPPVLLSDDEIELIKVLGKINGKEYEYIHRSGKYIFIFSDKPNIDKYGIILDGSNYLEITGHTDLFSNIKFEDGLYDIKNKCFIEV